MFGFLFRHLLQSREPVVHPSTYKRAVNRETKEKRKLMATRCHVLHSLSNCNLFRQITLKWTHEQPVALLGTFIAICRAQLQGGDRSIVMCLFPTALTPVKAQKDVSDIICIWIMDNPFGCKE